MSPQTTVETLRIFCSWIVLIHGRATRTTRLPHLCIGLCYIFITLSEISTVFRTVSSQLHGHRLKPEPWSSLVAQWVRNLALSLRWPDSLLWCKFKPWLRNFHTCCSCGKTNKQKKKKKNTLTLDLSFRLCQKSLKLDQGSRIVSICSEANGHAFWPLSLIFSIGCLCALQLLSSKHLRSECNTLSTLPFRRTIAVWQSKMKDLFWAQSYSYRIRAFSRMNTTYNLRAIN